MIRTALREAREELSHPLCLAYDFNSSIKVLGLTSTVPSLKGVIVTPVIGIFQHAFADEHTVTMYFPGNRSEVARVFTVSIEELLATETSEPLRRMGKGRHGPVFETKYGKIWGLTAIVLKPILHHLLRATVSTQATYSCH